ncbi:hypothetical protein VNI00_015149 [Paramarasmius palmivorus]|uniref:DUF659 domain-containing protein n=1 Tax=Paramarasmius palmivorus TaxID=297713 RepID=A0AAW0BKD7_9AGAR
MPPAKGPLWTYFYRGEKQNSSQYKAYCYRCIKQHRPSDAPIDIDGTDETMVTEPWFDDAVEKTKSTLGEKGAMAAHLKRCPFASKEAKRAAELEADDGDDEQGPVQKKRKLDEKGEKILKQTQLKSFKGLDILFTADQIPRLLAQFLRATLSAHLPFSWVEDPEVIKLLLMFRATACNVIPERKYLAGKLLDNADDDVEGMLEKFFKGSTATLSVQSFLIKVLRTNHWNKDGVSLCKAFCDMIDSAEAQYQCRIIAFVCDNDGGSQRGGKDLVNMRPWLFVFPCLAHQTQLILGDYFKENPEAADIAEKAVGFIGWINNHDKVREIFDNEQRERTGKVLQCIFANLTRWTTHFLAFSRLLELQEPFQAAALFHRERVITAQVGAEKNKKKRKKLEEDAKEHLGIAESRGYWDSLQLVVNDIAPVTYSTNISQSDSLCLDQFLIALAGLYLHFSKHHNAKVAAGMKKRLEQRWKDLDQEPFIIALILNPFERLDRFGDGAGLNVLTLNKMVTDLYKRIHSKPPAEPQTSIEEETFQATLLLKVRNVSQAFLAYMANTGSFETFRDPEIRESFMSSLGENPTAFWEAVKGDQAVADLADFAIILFDICPNQGGLERTFSDFSVNKTKRRNRLGLKKLEKMSKVTADIRMQQSSQGLLKTRKKRKNHSDDETETLLAVPQYDEVVRDRADTDSDQSDAEGRSRTQAQKSIFIKSKAAWRKELAKWQEKEHLMESHEPSESGVRVPTWRPTMLEKLFGGQVKRSTTLQGAQRALDDESRLMELLAAAHLDEEPDDGELEGSGDDYED